MRIYSKSRYPSTKHIISSPKTWFMIFCPRMEYIFGDPLPILFYMESLFLLMHGYGKCLKTDNWSLSIWIMSFLSVSVFYLLLIIFPDVIQLRNPFFSSVDLKITSVFDLFLNVVLSAIFSLDQQSCFWSISSLCRMIERVLSMIHRYRRCLPSSKT